MAGEENGSIEREIDDEDLIHGLLQVIETVRSFGEYRRTHKKASLNLIRRIKLTVPFLEEVRDHDMPIPDSAYWRLCNLLKAFNLAKKLLRCCHDGSKIYLALENEAVMGRFHSIDEKLSQAFDGMPYDELAISDEVREQVELMGSQLKRAKRRTDTQDVELAMDLMVVLAKKNDRNANNASLERLAQKLELRTLPDLSAETMAIKKLIKERSGQNAETTEQIIDLLNKFKKLAGIEDNNALKDVNLPKYFEKCPSLMIPSDFLCPVTLEIMTDPVIVASGQTYERSSIRKWFDAGQRTCPKTRQTLTHLTVAPNYALRNLIVQWCEKNKIELSKKEESLGSEPANQKEGIETLVRDLTSIQLNVQRKAVKKIRMLSKENPDNRILIAKSGGIPSLVSLLTYPDSKIQENAVTALLNLSIDEVNKMMITKEGAIPSIIDILKNGTVMAKENSAAAIFSLSMINENKALIGSLNGIPLLVDLLENGTIRGKKDAATALFNLCLNQENKVRAIKAGVFQPLLQLLGDKNLGMVDEALSIFLLLTSHPDGRAAVGKIPLIETLVELIKEGNPKNKEHALSLLLELGLQDSNFIVTALKSDVHEHVCKAAKTGTNRAQRKANSLLQLMNECGHKP